MCWSNEAMRRKNAEVVHSSLLFPFGLPKVAIQRAKPQAATAICKLWDKYSTFSA
jgi:hypothetical protein